MALKRGGLGRGLDSLIPDKKKEQTKRLLQKMRESLLRRHPEKRRVQRKLRNRKMRPALQYRVKKKNIPIIM